MSEADTGRLLIRCGDQPGIVAAVATFLRDAGANIVASDQYSTDPEGGRFFMRTEFHLPRLADRLAGLERAFGEHVGTPFGMDWRLSRAAAPKRMAVLVSRYDHVLVDLLWRWQRGALHADIPVVVSNHDDLRGAVEAAGVAYEHVPWDDDAEERMLALLAGRCDLAVLARYMRILSGGFLERLGAPVINIHHSFLPAFAGADPYRRAKERGVKIIGATAHYVTEELDAGPIIEQDVQRVSHADDVAALTRAGEDIERAVLARAVRLHLDDRVVVDGATTVIL